MTPNEIFSRREIALRIIRREIISSGTTPVESTARNRRNVILEIDKPIAKLDKFHREIDYKSTSSRCRRGSARRAIRRRDVAKIRVGRLVGSRDEQWLVIGASRRRNFSTVRSDAPAEGVPECNLNDPSSCQRPGRATGIPTWPADRARSRRERTAARSTCTRPVGRSVGRPTGRPNTLPLYCHLICHPLADRP